MTSAPSGHPAISIQAATKQYGTLKAVDNLSLDVHEGEVVGFLGLNGAGKTTTIRILLDLLRPTAGRAFLFGHDCHAGGLEARALTGYLPGEMGLYTDLTGRDVLDLLAGLAGRPVDRQLRLALEDRLELSDRVLKQKLREYSTGMKRKLGLIQAFQSDPPLLILDEPTEGLDPLMQEVFYQMVVDARARGRTVFMSSHVLSEVERVCDRIALMRKGQLILFSTVEEARAFASRRVRVVFSEIAQVPSALPPGCEIVEYTSHVWQLKVDGVLGPLMKLLAPLPVNDIHVAEPRLEDVLLTLYRGDSGEAPRISTGNQAA